MADPFVGEIRIVPFNFAPNGWALCNGQIMPISQNTALFSLLGTYYGGDGRSNFALPNLQNAVPVDAGNSSVGLSDRLLGEIGGAATVALVSNQIPQHSHVMNADAGAATSQSPSGNLTAVPATGRRRPDQMYATSVANTPMLTGNALAAGGGQPHNNQQPYLVLNFVIALQGIYPARS